VLQAIRGNLYPDSNLGVTVRDITFRYACFMESRKKGLLFWKKNHNDDIQWGTGWGTSYWVPNSSTPCTNYIYKEFCHGTGWAANQADINYTLQLEQYTIRFDHPFSCESPDEVVYLYNNNFIRNLDVSGLFCEDDCWVRGCN